MAHGSLYQYADLTGIDSIKLDAWLVAYPAGAFERMVKFERAAVQALVRPPEATAAIKGQLAGGTLFEGTAVLHVLNKERQEPVTPLRRGGAG